MVKVLDLFSGIGGFSLGLERAGFETVAFCEIDKKARQVLKKHWPEVPIFEDVTTLTKDKLDERGISVDVICGGFPCQDISVAGKGAGIEGERSGLWSEFARLISELRPRYAIVENVSALLHRGLDRVLGDLAQIGYDAEWHCIPASAVGAPHRRDRIWIVAYPNRNGQRPWNGSEQSTWDTAGERFGDGSKLERVGMVADTESDRWTFSGSRDNRRSIVEEKKREGKFSGVYTGNGAWPLAHSDSTRLQGWQEAGNFSGIWPRLQQFLERCPDSIGSTWAVEPDVGRVAHGVPGRVDRLKQLGNAVVPQIPELIGRAIMECYKK